MTIFLIVVGTVASVLTIVSSLYLFYSPFRRLWWTRVPGFVGVKYNRSWTMDDVNGAIRDASDRVWVLQTWIPTLNSDIGKWRDMNEKVTFRILLANDSIAQARIKYRPPCIPLSKHNVDVIKNFNEHGYGPRIELKHYDGLPFGPIYIIDDTIYWGLYLPHLDSMIGPQFISSRQSLLGTLMEQSFEAVWSRETLKDSLPASLDDELEDTRSAGYKRHCNECNIWLEYRSLGPPNALTTESFCPNRQCSKFNVKVEDVHVS